MIQSPEHFLMELRGKAAVITLNRPERKNPLTFESYAELRDTFNGLGRDSGARAVVIHGADGNFCSGGDVHEIIGPLLEMDGVALLRFTRMTGDLVKAMRHCPLPVVAAVDGVCAGAGAAIAMAADLRTGTARSRIAFLFARVGLAGCDMGACALLPRIIGQGRAAELLLTGRAMPGEEAHQVGFLNRLEEPERLLDASIAWAEQLASGPNFAHAMTKSQLNSEWEMPLETALEAEAQAQAICMHTEDFRRAYEAFVRREQPRFEGD
ncbi:MAG: enoyl-CoA hydratase family protein [Gammaproteobacteria bacterium]|nr:enoyl-CoA hydratase family protein [Gammaproteobacteria bacterium]